MKSPPMVSPSIEIAQFKQKLISATIANALRTEFYRAHWADHDLSKPTLESLVRLPPVGKEQLRAAGESARNRDDLICDEVFTSGTTSEPFVTVRGDREQQFIRQFFAALYSGPEFAKRRRGIEINNPYHGAAIDVPGPVHRHRIGIYDRGSFEHARCVMTKNHLDRDVSPVCTILFGLERALRAFALDTLSLYPEGLRTSIEFIIPYGQYVSARGRRLLETAFGGRVYDRYGMSEIFGGAAQDPACGWYHFDASIFAEVVSPKTMLPIEEGTGLLLLTALYPFQEAQPLVRYYSGDIVLVTHTLSSRPGEIAIKPLGRERYSVPRPDREGWIVVPAEIYEVIDATPEIQCSLLFRDSAQVRDPAAVGHPRYNVTYEDRNGRRDITVQFELRKECVDQADATAERLREQILQSSTGLNAWCAQGNGRLAILARAEFPSDVISYRE